MNGGLLGSLGVGRQDVVQVKEVACSRSNLELSKDLIWESLPAAA